ncbi:hypothetical protein ACCO45_005425 [Purpureocillium lilacinum]|uniref:Uncharacterized protein n=1 Tax=Purpureocillium lilacinum TaxID=33203 RepID=A0ACC4DYG1_PURLI
MAPSDKCGNAACTTSSSAPSPPDASSLRLCSRCRKIKYCSSECQTAAWPTHKRGCIRPNYIVKFHLSPDDIASPPVTRTLSCPSHAVFYMLHMALQTAFGWATTHSFDFAVVDPRTARTTTSWASSTGAWPRGRRAGLPPASTPREYVLRVVDPVEQTMFSGIDRMHEGMRRHPNTTEKKADKFKLFEMFDDARFQGHKMVYTYDFGDNWEHYMTILGRADATPDFICLDGSGHYVAEDVGSTQGWEKLKAAYQTQSPTEEQKGRRKWFERDASNADPRGLAGDRVNTWDRDAINRALETETMLDRFQAMGDVAAENSAKMEAMLRKRN